MSEEFKVVNSAIQEPEVKQPEPEAAPQTREFSDVEKRAMEMGWNPDFDGPEENFIDAKEFIRRKPLFEKIEHQSKELKSVRKALEAWKIHYTSVEKAAVQKAMAALEAQRQDAISNADGEAFARIDKELKQAERQAQAIEAAAAQPAVEDTPAEHPEFSSWKNRNPWYDSTKYMREFADDLGPKLAARGMSPQEVLKEVEKAVREEFPHKFRNPNKDSAPSVETSGRSAGTGSKKDSFELNDLERKIMNTLIASSGGKITKEKYIADLKEIKGLK